MKTHAATEQRVPNKHFVIMTSHNTKCTEQYLISIIIQSYFDYYLLLLSISRIKSQAPPAHITSGTGTKG